MTFVRRLIAAVLAEIRDAFKLITYLRWPLWLAWLLCIAIACVGFIPQDWTLPVQGVITVCFGVIALLSGSVARLARHRRWVWYPQDVKVISRLPQFITFFAFPPFFLAMAVLFWRMSQVIPGTFPIFTMADAFVLATENFLKSQLFFDVVEIFRMHLIARDAWPPGLAGKTVMLALRIIMDFVFLKLAIQFILAGYYRARGVGRGEDNIVLLARAVNAGDISRTKQLSLEVQHALHDTIDTLVRKVDPTKRKGRRAWRTLQTMEQYVVPYLENKIKHPPNTSDSAEQVADAQRALEWFKNPDKMPSKLEHFQPYESRRWPYVMLLVLGVALVIVPYLIRVPELAVAVATVVLFTFAFALISARWCLAKLFWLKALQPYTPSTLPWLQARWSLSIVPFLVAAATVLFWHLEQLFEGTFEYRHAKGEITHTGVFSYVLENLTRTQIFMDAFEVYRFDISPVEATTWAGCLLTLLLRMIFDLGFISLWVVILGIWVNYFLRFSSIQAHMDMKMCLEAHSNYPRAPEFIEYYYTEIQKVVFDLMLKVMNNGNMLAALGWTGFLPLLRDHIEHERDDGSVSSQENAAHHANLGQALRELGQLEEAAQEEMQAVATQKENVKQRVEGARNLLAEAHIKLGRVREEQHRWRQAMREYQNAVELYVILEQENRVKNQSELAKANNRLAWLYATCPLVKLRNGNKAIELAKHACELTNYDESDYIDTLATAYAEIGDFPKAITTIKEALEKSKDEEQRDEFNERLKGFEQGKPFHQLY